MLGLDLSIGRLSLGPGDAANGATLALDFVRGLFRAKGDHGRIPGDLDAWSFSRAGPAIAPAASVSLLAFASGEPRLTDQGLLLEEERTNTCTNFNAEPTDATNILFAGGTGASLTVVDDSAALDAAGLSAVCTSGKAFRIIGGAAGTYALFGGDAGNANPHSISAYVRSSGDGHIEISGGAGSQAFGAGATYQRIVKEGLTPAADARMALVVEAGVTAYFVLNQMEEGAFATSPIVVAGMAATRIADVAAVADAIAASGTVLVEFTAPPLTSGAQTLVGSPSDALLYVTGGLLRSYVNATQLGSGALGAGTNRAALAWTGAGRRLCLNGGSVEADGQVPATGDLAIGWFSAMIAQPNTAIRRVLVFDRTLSDAELQALTA